MSPNHPNHPYRSLHVPSDAPFELKPSPGKGWVAFATRRIERGDMILKEKPFFIIRKSHEEITEEDVWTAFHRLVPEACAENSFAISIGIKPRSNDLPAHGLFLLHSRFNHSSIPNSKFPTAIGEIVTSFATRDIVASEEITFCYNSDFECRTRHDRHQAPRSVCDCKAYLTGTPFQQLNDMRRTLIRGLQYLTAGVDINRQRQGSASPIIADPKLKKAAEDFSIPISARLIYNLLTICLLEEEGLLDDFMVERLNPGILQTAAFFKMESNARIARLAMKQETWLEKACVACKLYGRGDVADDNVAEML